jgi:flagellar FliL protein
MSEASAPEEASGPETASGKSRKPLLIGLVLALLGGGAGYFAVSSGMLGPATVEAGHQSDETHAESAVPPMYEEDGTSDVRFVELPQLVVSLGPDATARHLRFTAAIETNTASEAEVAQLQPRILDVMNGYLRALEPADIEEPGGLFLIRGQLTRRLQLVLGEDRMRDLLVLEFVLN